MVRLVVAGGRGITDYQFVKSKLNAITANIKEPIEIVSGSCDTGKLTYTRPDGTVVCGVDGLGERYAAEKGHNVVYFPAAWKTNGKAAGPIRNRQMGEYCTHGCVVWDGASAGSKSMVDILKELGRPLREIIYKPSVK